MQVSYLPEAEGGTGPEPDGAGLTVGFVPLWCHSDDPSDGPPAPLKSYSLRWRPYFASKLLDSLLGGMR